VWALPAATSAGAATHPAALGRLCGRSPGATAGHPARGAGGGGPRPRRRGGARCRHPHHPSAAGRWATGTTSLRSVPAPRGGHTPPRAVPCVGPARTVGGPTWCSAAAAAGTGAGPPVGRGAGGRGPHGRGAKLPRAARAVAAAGVRRRPPFDLARGADWPTAAAWHKRWRTHSSGFLFAPPTAVAGSQRRQPSRRWASFAMRGRATARLLWGP